MVPVARILVATDFSEPAATALKWAATLAQEFDGRLIVLHVVPEPYAYPWGSEMSTMPLTEILAQTEKDADDRLREIAAGIHLPRGPVITRVVIGTPVDQILETIAAENIDLVVLGTHGRGMVGHLLLGSVVERVVRRSPVPVLSVHGETRALELKRDASAVARN
ncbi:MAG TPA: universal stress protein [Vicinamibacterales bacterium]|nr:universal stress protein [Vicinamibacterales bacterium]